MIEWSAMKINPCRSYFISNMKLNVSPSYPLQNVNRFTFVLFSTKKILRLLLRSLPSEFDISHLLILLQLWRTIHTLKYPAEENRKYKRTKKCVLLYFSCTVKGEPLAECELFSLNAFKTLFIYTVGSIYIPFLEH